MEQTEELKEAALRLFGSEDLGHVVDDLATEPMDRDPSGLIARALKGEESDSGDSALEEFQAMRRAAKESSQPDTSARKPAPTSSKPKPAFSAPKAVVKAKAAVPRAPQPGFVRLELVESSSEEAEDPEPSSEEEEEDTAHLRVLSRLLAKVSPSSDCPWDAWLEATHAWPHLKLKLPGDFCRKGSDLRVTLEVEVLKQLIEEEKCAQANAKQRKREEVEHHAEKVKEYIREAELRRELMRKRLGAVLAPRSEQLEEMLRKDKAAKPPKETSPKPKAAKAASAKAASLGPGKAAASAKATSPSAEVKAEAAAARMKLMEEEKAAKARQEKIDLLLQEVSQHRLPLWDDVVSAGCSLPSLQGEIFLLPWDEEAAPTLCRLAGENQAQAMLMLPLPQVAQAYASHPAWPSKPPTCRSLVAVEASADAAGEKLLGPFPAQPLQRPLALWAHEEGKPELDVEVLEETICVAFQKLEPEILEVVLQELAAQGLQVVGLRLLRPASSAASARSAGSVVGISVGLRAALAAEKVLLLALRAPHALQLWRAMLGPSDPALARQTDPESLNARFGGQSRAEALALAPSGKAADVVWAFGGRSEAFLGEATQALHAIQVLQPKVYCLELSEVDVSCCGTALCAAALRSGRLLDLRGCGESRVLVHGFREGGAGFLRHCPLGPPPGDLGSGRPVAFTEKPPLAISELLPPVAPVAAVEEDFDAAEPEVLVVALAPQSGLKEPLLLRDATEALYQKFRPEACYEVGSCVELLDVRVLDLQVLGGATAQAALQGFQNFAQLARHALEDASRFWWSAGKEHGLVALLCFRGDKAISRFKTFLAREWKLSAATEGDVLFSPSREVARRAVRCFFGHLELPTFAQLPPQHFFSLRRFQPATETGAAERLSEAVLFPKTSAEQRTLAVLSLEDSVVYKALSAADQHGFMLEALALEAPAALQRELFQQEVADGSLRPEDWDAFQPTMARCLVLELSRRQAVKRFAQLCGGADPQVNHRQLRVSLRSGDRIRNGLRCATSLHSAAALLRAAVLDAPSSDAARGVGLDAEAAEQGLELALVVASSAEPLLPLGRAGTK
ncbi:unnamed protein product [Effrenium voratum]|nr:unnamed protein product [Effrenium voratum]